MSHDIASFPVEEEKLPVARHVLLEQLRLDEFDGLDPKLGAFDNML